MVWQTFETCPSCGKQHILCWPHDDVPDNLKQLMYKCPELDKTVVLWGIRAWSSADSCAVEAVRLAERP